MKLYLHKTDGGAEYLTTTENDLSTAVVRLDGQPEMMGNLAQFETYRRKIAALYEERAKLREIIRDLIDGEIWEQKDATEAARAALNMEEE